MFLLQCAVCKDASSAQTEAFRDLFLIQGIVMKLQFGRRGRPTTDVGLWAHIGHGCFPPRVADFGRPAEAEILSLWLHYGACSLARSAVGDRAEQSV